MPLMSVTLEVSQLRGWLKASARCRGSQAGHTVRGGLLGRRGLCRGEGVRRPDMGAGAGTLTTPGLDRGKSCVGLRGVSPRDGYLAHNTTQGTQENLPTVAEVTASIRA